MIANNRGQMTKHLWTDVGEGDPVRVREMADEHAEARWVTAEIERLVDEGVSRAEIAVFYRTNAQSRVLEDMLVRAGVAYQVIGGTKFYERAEIKDAVAVPDVPGQPAGRDGVHADRELAASAGSGRRRCPACSRYAERPRDRRSGTRRAARSPAWRRRRARRSARFMDTMERAAGARPRRTARSRSCSTSCWTRRATWTRCEAERTIEAQGRLENLEELVSAVAREYDINAPRAARSGSSCSRRRCSPTRTTSATTRAS